MTAKTIRLAYLFVVAVALVVLFFVPWMTVLGHPRPQACGASPPEGPAHPWLENQFAAVALSLGGLLVGSIASYVGKVKQLSQITWLRGLFMGGGRNVRRAEGSVQIGLLLLLIFSTGALLYETWALFNRDWAVTDYVHCGNDVNPGLAAAGALALALLLGNWLWHAAPSGPDS